MTNILSSKIKHFAVSAAAILMVVAAGCNSRSSLTSLQDLKDAPREVGAIEGKVLEKIKMSPISDARVYVDGQPQHAAVSDKNGIFRIEGVPLGRYNVAMRAYGFEPDFVMNIDVTSDKKKAVDFLLNPVKVQVEKVVVLLVEFPDLRHKPEHNKAYFQKILFSDDIGVSSLRNYVYEVSKGRIDIQLGKFVGWLVDEDYRSDGLEDSERDDIADFAIHAAEPSIDYSLFDSIQNYDRKPKPDGRVDHVMIIHAGEPQTMTAKKSDMNPTCMLNTEYVSGIKTSQQVFISESAPLGNFVHEFFHDMGDRSVQDLYMGGDPPPATVGQWEVMSVGMYNPLDALTPPYFDRVGYLPSYPLPWSMGRWYHGALRDAIGKTQKLSRGDKIELTIFPFETQSDNLKVVTIPLDETREISVVVRQRLGFDRGLKGQGVLISKVDYSLAGSMNLLGPVRIEDAHPKSLLPTYLHFDYDYELDDAAFDVGPGKKSHYESEGVRIDVKEANADGSYRVAFEVK